MKNESDIRQKIEFYIATVKSSKAKLLGPKVPNIETLATEKGLQNACEIAIGELYWVLGEKP